MRSRPWNMYCGRQQHPYEVHFKNIEMSLYNLQGSHSNKPRH